MIWWRPRVEGTISVTLCAIPNGDGDKLDARSGQCHFEQTGKSGHRARFAQTEAASAASAPPERIVVEQIRGRAISYVVFNGDDERLSQEKALQDSLPPAAAAAAAAKPKKECKNCEKGKQRAKPQGGGAVPTPGATPSPTPAPGSGRIAATRRSALAENDLNYVH